MERLTGVIRPYAWGSRHALATLQGRPVPSEGPEAEFWLGAHPGDPSALDRGRLDELIAADPVGVLGEESAAEFGPRLPFLFKVLAAEEPLSLQAHPDAAHAAARYAEGNVNYVDDQHKPEILVALAPFETLCGFREPGVTADLLAGVPALAKAVELLRAGDLRGAVEFLLTSPPGLVAEVLAGGLPAEQRALVGHLADRYPGDLGALVALLLNHVVLEPGQAIFMPAGNLHAYIRGMGVELMAASDNVLRGGLTPKRVDVPELLDVLRFEALADPVVRSVPVSPGLEAWPVPVREFALYRATVSDTPVELDAPGPRIILCTSGRVTANGLELARGEAGFATATEGPIVMTGHGEAYLAAVAR
ncbi:mannose-6-phosphate isomerase, class I [Longispora urticae]